jgi:hypothetical protein
MSVNRRLIVTQRQNQGKHTRLFLSGLILKKTYIVLLIAPDLPDLGKDNCISLVEIAASSLGCSLLRSAKDKDIVDKRLETVSTQRKSHCRLALMLGRR